MVHNRNKLINLFIGNAANAVLHRILENAINDEAIAQRYVKEATTSLSLAKAYRKKIHPISIPLPIKDSGYTQQKIIKKVKVELSLRIEKGYEHLDRALVEPFVKHLLQEAQVL